MSTSRPESQSSQYGRRRSNTAQSISRNPLPSPLKNGDSKILNLWVHDTKESINVLFNHAWWPGVAEGDMLRVTGCNSDGSSGFLFIVSKDDGNLKPNLQICIPLNVAETFGLRNNEEVVVTKVDEAKHSADYVEFIFQDQYLGRNDMWRLGKHLVGQCICVEQEVSFIGAIAAKIQEIHVNGDKVSAAYMTPSTKAIYRSLSARVTIFIQVCRELWEFAGDGERYSEKIVHSFLPTLFAKWREAGTNHTVTIVLISRVYYDQSETDYAAGPLQRDEEGKWYKDFYKVTTDLDVIYEWKETLVDLKNSFGDFQKDILLGHHYHRATLGPGEEVRLVGRLSFAHEGPVLEALNLGLTSTESHYIDRSLSLTGASTLVISPGTGYFRVSKHLLRLTTTRMLDQGFGVDLICLTKPPLHQSPILSFQGTEPELRMDLEGNHGTRSLDPLWGGDDDASESSGREKTTFWWDPFWMTVSFWDTQMDLPFRQDRFIARATMHEIQTLGLLAQDVLSKIEVPFLPDLCSDSPPGEGFSAHRVPSELEARNFDMDTFALKTESPPSNSNRHSYSSSASGTIMASSLRSLRDRRGLHRESTVSTLITPIEESPRPNIKDLPNVELSSTDGKTGKPPSSILSTSPSQFSTSSDRSDSPVISATASLSHEPTPARTSLTSKFAPSWLLKPFRSASQTESKSSDSVSPPTTLVSTPPTGIMRPSSPIRVPTESKPATRTPKPMAIKKVPSNRSVLNRAFDEDSVMSHRSQYSRRSPLNTPPRDDITLGKRRSGVTNSLPALVTRTNPSRPQSSVAYVESSLARRWQHMFPRFSYKHEIKWKSIVTPGCLPLTVEYFPSVSELDSLYDVSSWHFVVDPQEMRSFLVQPPDLKGNADEMRRAWALVVMRGMAAVRLAQGFQFVLRSTKAIDVEDKAFSRTRKSFLVEEDMAPKPTGAAEVLNSTDDPIYLSMSNEIHRISYTGEAIQVRRYFRRMPPSPPFDYQCLIWPKLGVGYTEWVTSFTAQGPQSYGWNRLDMLIAGYEHQFSESLRYWRTRFVVIPAAEPPSIDVGPSGEKLNEEEIRLLGIDKLAELFTKLRWRPPEERSTPITPIRFLPTTLGPARSVLDDGIIAQLDEIHAAGPLRKKVKSEREIGDMSRTAIAKAMREEGGVRIKNHKWHTTQYPDSFTGFDFVSWLVREFRDVSSRTQGTEMGVKLLEAGLFEHCKGHHGFLDGHYFYRLKGEFAVPVTPRRWFSSSRKEGEDSPRPATSSVSRLSSSNPRKTKVLILSQTMVIDIDPNKRSDQAETVILHHDILHNPTTVFHFELQWIGTTARCIEDQLRQWSRSIERYGLKLVEAYVSQISDIRARNALQSCYPLRLAVPPPVVPDLDKRIPEGFNARHYFEIALLRHFNFVLDVEAGSVYPEEVDVVYSYRRSPHKYSQFVHRTGVAFVQVVGDTDGFLYLTNRLIGPGRMGTALGSRGYRPATAAKHLLEEMRSVCLDEAKLRDFYDKELASLGGGAPEEPPPLTI